MSWLNISHNSFKRRLRIVVSFWMRRKSFKVSSTNRLRQRFESRPIFFYKWNISMQVKTVVKESSFMRRNLKSIRQLSQISFQIYWARTIMGWTSFISTISSTCQVGLGIILITMRLFWVTCLTISSIWPVTSISLRNSTKEYHLNPLNSCCVFYPSNQLICFRKLSKTNF